MTGPSGGPGAEIQQADSPALAEVAVTEQVPDELAADKMSELLATGRAEHLSHHVVDFTTWNGSWWTLRAHETWIRIDDAELHATLDRYSWRMKNGLFG